MKFDGRSPMGVASRAANSSSIVPGLPPRVTTMMTGGGAPLRCLPDGNAAGTIAVRARPPRGPARRRGGERARREREAGSARAAGPVAPGLLGLPVPARQADARAAALG